VEPDCCTAPAPLVSRFKTIKVRIRMVTPGRTAPRLVKRARNGTAAVFAANGFVFASWMSRVPDVKARLDLAPGRLSILLLAISAGSVLGLPLAGRIGNHLGASKAVRLGAAIGMPGVALAGLMVQVRAPFALLVPGLFLLGLGIGIWDVSQNLEGTVVERASGKPIMPWFHAAFSLGTVLGAVVGAGLTSIRAPIGTHIAVAAALSLVVIAWGTAGFVHAGGERDYHSETDTPRSAANSAWSAWIEPRTLLIGVMVLAAAFTEGTANDWMAVAFVDGHHVARALGVIALAVFLSFMTIGRILGTRLLDRHGRVPVLRTLFGAAIVGCVLVVFGHLWLAFVGAAIWGFGASLGFPVGMSAAADDPRRAALRLSVVSTIGYAAFLGGPPLLGFLGDHFGVLHALITVGAVSVLAVLVAPVAKPKARDPEYRSPPAAGGRALEPTGPCNP
jgi:MFS family permease